VVRLSESPLALEVRWRATATGPVVRVGTFDLDLHGLLKAGCIRRERSSDPEAVRLRIVKEADGALYVQVNADGPRSPLGYAD
jgi:hypothetical protein